MIGNQYKVHKDNVIDLFNNYKAKRGDLNDGVDINFLEKRVNLLKNDKFILAVAGEVKAGKSTFINALLGAEILPSDVLQASSANVEIFKSETSCLKVKFADGKEESLYYDPETADIDEAKKRLNEICKINDEFRTIPARLIDDFIIESDGKLTVNENFIKELEMHSGVDLQDKQVIIEQYISKRTKDKIPVKIEFGYPLKWKFDELRIVDTPGVNAIGGVQDVSFRFFEEANAILFVHPIKPIESESFRKFVDTVISNRSKETLFLILTHAGLYSNDEVERLYSEARRLYKNIIPENRILVVDSLLKLIHWDLKNGVPLQEIRKSENKKKILSSYKEQAENEKRELIDVVNECSRFEKMFDVIDEFSMKAPNLQLQEILEQIKKGYEEQEILYTEKADRLKKKKRNPQEFEEAINHIKRGLDDYKLKAKEIKENLSSSYFGEDNTWEKDVATIKDKYGKLIKESNRIYEVRKLIYDARDEMNSKVNFLLNEITQRLADALEEKAKKIKKDYKLSPPKVDMKAIMEESKKESYKIKVLKIPRSWDFWDYLGLGIPRLFRNREKEVESRVFDNHKYLTTIKDKCEVELTNIFKFYRDESKRASEIFLKRFSKEIGLVIKNRQKELEKEREKKQSNEDIIKEIKELNRKKKGIHPEKIRCIEVLEDII